MFILFITFAIVPFQDDFSLAVSSLISANQLIRYNNQLMVVEQCFTNIAAIQNMGALIQIWNYEIYWGGGGGGGGGGITDTCMSKYHNAGIWSMY